MLAVLDTHTIFGVRELLCWPFLSLSLSLTISRLQEMPASILLEKGGMH